MPELRFTEYPVLPTDLRIRISQSASEIADCLFFLPNIRNIVVFIIIFLKGENLRHDHVLITVNIFSIKRKQSATREENQLHLRSYKADFNAVRLEAVSPY